MKHHVICLLILIVAVVGLLYDETHLIFWRLLFVVVFIYWIVRDYISIRKPIAIAEESISKRRVGDHHSTRDVVDFGADPDDEIVAFEEAISGFKEEEAFFEESNLKVEEDDARLKRVSDELDRFAGRLEEKFETGLTVSTGKIRYPIRDREGRPDVFMRGNEKSIRGTNGYRRVKEICERRGLDVELKTDYEEQCLRQMDWDWKPALAPTLYHVEMVIARSEQGAKFAQSAFQ